MPYFRKDFGEPVIVLIQMGRVKFKCYDVAAEVKITSSYDATQLPFNGDSTEFVEFRESVRVDELLAKQPKVMIKIPKELKTMLGRVKHFPEMFNTYCPGLLDDYDDGLSSKLQLTDYESDSDEVKEEAESPNVNAVKEQSVHVIETDAVKRSLLDQFSSTQNSKKKRVMVVKEEKGDDDKET
nr:putative transposase [Ipomoea trifida]